MVYRAIQEFDFAALNRLAPISSRTNAAALGFFSRTGYSFLAHFGGAIHGFVLAQPVWQGDRTVVWIAEILGDSPSIYGGLLAEVVKVAYQTGMLEIYLPHPPQGADLNQALREQGFTIGALQLSVRFLEARGAKGETEGLLE
jgi:hypothetical protein